MFKSKDEITIKIKTLNTTTFPIDISKNAKISELKAAIFQKVRIHYNNQKLIFQGKVLEDTKSIKDYKLEQYDVIHLVETDNRHYQEPPSSNQNQNSNSNLGEYERLINSIFPSFDDILGSLRGNINNNNNNRNNNLNNNANINNNNQINSNNRINENNNGNVINEGYNDEEGIFDSFKHLLNSKTYNYVKAGEVITQNMDNLYNMYNNLIDLNIDNTKSIKKLYSLNYNTNFKVGQWIDIKDRNDNWIEGQIMGVRDQKVKVQYIGMPPNMNEWINTTSDRIALFRTYTLQKNLKNFFSLYPNKSQEYSREQIHVQENIPIYYTGIKKFEPLNNHLVLFMDLFKEKIKNIMKIKEQTERGLEYFSSKNEFLDTERFYFLSCMQIFPLLDRFGRIMIDLANYLMYNSYKYFEDNIFNFRKNVYDESLRFMNIHDRKETVNKNRLKHFQTLVQFSCAKIEKDENVQNIQNSNNTENNRRPIYGIFINRPREPNRQDYINRSRRYMVSREHIDIISNNNSKKNLSEYTQTDPIQNIFKRIKQDKKVINIFIKSSYEKNIIAKNDNIENININKTNNNGINVNLNININNSQQNKNNNNILLRSTANNHANIVKREKIQIEAKKKEEDPKEINIKTNNNHNLNNVKLHKSVDKYGISLKTRKGTYKLAKSKGKIFKKK